MGPPKKTKTKTTSSVDLPPTAQRGLEHISNQALVAGENFDPFTGNFTATPGQSDEKFLASLRRDANVLGRGGFAGDILDLGSFLASPESLDVANDPINIAASQANTDQISRFFNESAAPGLRSDLGTQGGGSAFRNLRGDFALANQKQDFGQIVGEQASQFNAGLLENARDRQLRAGDILQQGFSLQTAPSFLLGQVSQQERLNEQARLDNELAKFREIEGHEFATLERQAPLIFGAAAPFAGQSSGTFVGPGQGQSKGASALAGGLGGAALGATAGPVGAGVGFVLGGLGGYFIG